MIQLIEVPEQQSLAPVREFMDLVDQAIQTAFLLRRMSQPKDLRVTATRVQEHMK